MVFSSPFFLFLFLPVTLAAYFLLPNRLRNSCLLIASLLFYLVGAGVYIAILLFSIGSNFWFGHRIEASRGTRNQKRWLVAAILTNLLPLLVFKYEAFFAGLGNSALVSASLKPALPILHLFLPAGISFFTFQGLAYVIDVYRQTIPCSRSLIRFAVFKSFFPQLVAGPIVRYRDLAADLEQRQHSLPQVSDGLVRFGNGLAKKILIADNLGRVADAIFNAGPTEWSVSNAWLGLVCYTLQIFFDFSGYSDMAIGLGRICGLRLPENFLQPYRATSVTDFWRRWHMTLSNFFRDYVYIPLGGNRHGSFRTALNLLIVFALCGLWHGASVTFLVWGLFHGALLTGERLVKNVFGFAPRGIGGVIYTLLAVMGGWVWFRTTSLAQAGQYFAALVGLNSADPTFPVGYHLTRNVVFFLLAGVIIAFLPERTESRSSSQPSRLHWRSWFAVAITAWALVAQSPQTFNPFIYFQF